MLTITRTWGKPGANYTASHASTSALVLHGLSQHNDVKVRTAVADNENTSADTSMRLAQDNSADLRYALAENHHIHRSVLDFLALDENPFVADRARKTILRLKQAIPKLLQALKISLQK